jgi:DsbC/DsbD-like thiol-disulfide interchange protein
MLLTVALLAVASYQGSDRVGSATITAAVYAPGKPVAASLRFRVKKGWHTYWLNPGDNGYGPTVTWKLPKGWAASAIDMPVPKRMGESDAPAFGYEGDVAATVVFTAPAIAKGPVTLQGQLRWMACEASCVPLQDTLTLRLSPATATRPPAPVPTKPRTLRDGQALATRIGDAIHLTLPATSGLGTPDDFFPLDGGVLDHGIRPSVEMGKDGWALVMKVSPYATKLPPRLRGLLVTHSGKGVPVDVPLAP